MASRKASRPTSATTEREPRDGDLGRIASATPKDKVQQDRAIRADIIGLGRCQAEGHAVRGASPVLALCRRLVEVGFDPNWPLHAYREDTLCLVVHSIGEAAHLDINSKGTGFVRCRQAVRIAPPITPLERPAARQSLIAKMQP